jgi:hypothetical protein
MLGRHRGRVREDRERTPSGGQAVTFRFADETRTVCIIAGGPSVTETAAKCCVGYPTIAVNDAYRLAPWADVLYACDDRWWDHHIGKLRGRFAGQLWTQARTSAERYGLNWICGESKDGLCKQPHRIHFGQNSGYQAINLAYHWEAKRLVLLGFDCKQTDKTHWFGAHPKGLEQKHPYQSWIRNFARLAADLKREGIEVINCSMDSALTCWPKVSVEVALARVCPDPAAALLPA